MKLRLAVVAVLAPIISAAGATGASAQDIEIGRALVEENCARCHNIGPVGRPKQLPPDFAEIARYRTAGWIRAYIIAPHISLLMPTDVFRLLDAEELDAAVAYIVSLEAP